MGGHQRINGLAAVVMGLFLTTATAGLDPRLSGVNDWLYVLQPAGEAELDAIAASDFDLAVVDYSADGGASGEFTAPQIADLKATGKLVLAYLSIGEAETYRFYWDPSWNDGPPPDPDAPAWLGPYNPDFPDNCKVRYWDPDWQAILFGTASGPRRSYLDRILDQGFDGVYLDIIDAFTFWSDEEPERTREGARQDMIALVRALADYARLTRGVADFLVFSQNGEDVIVDDGEVVDASGLSYLATIDGIGVEDVFYDELTPQPAEEVAYRTGLLASYLSAGGATRRVLSVDYVWNEGNPAGAANVSRYNDYQTEALAHSYVPYAAVSDRDLDEILVVTLSGGIQYPQPKPEVAIFADGFESGDTSGWSSATDPAPQP